MLFEHAVFLAAALNCWECNCFLIGINNQCWLGVRAEPPHIKNVCWSLEIREQVAKSSTYRSDYQGMLCLYLGNALAQKTGFPFSYQKK